MTYNKIEFNIISDLGPNVFLISIGNDSFVLKYKKRFTDHTDIMEKFLYPLLSHRFKRELNLNCYLMDNPAIDRSHAKLLFFEKRNYMIFEYINPNALDIAIDDHKIVESYLQFQSALKDFRFSLFSRVYSLNMSFIYLSFRFFLITRSFKHLFLLLNQIIKLNIIQEKLTNNILHKDLKYRKNTISSDKLKLYFIDFETVTIERKWIMLDIVDIAFNPMEFSLNMNLLNAYYNRLDSYTKSKTNIEAQIRFALLRRSVGSYYRDLGHKNELFTFLDSVLLSEKSFKDWINLNVI